jgi:hypothetical protein
MTFIKHHGNLFYGVIVAVAMIGPILLIITAGKMPEDLQRGELIVFGHGVILAAVAAAMVVRAAYALGFNKALKIAVSGPNYSVTA